jgi:hypothetical protein
MKIKEGIVALSFYAFLLAYSCYLIFQAIEAAIY